jgi:hypothetical protein
LSRLPQQFGWVEGQVGDEADVEVLLEAVVFGGDVVGGDVTETSLGAGVDDPGLGACRDPPPVLAAAVVLVGAVVVVVDEDDVVDAGSELVDEPCDAATRGTGREPFCPLPRTTANTRRIRAKMASSIPRAIRDLNDRRRCGARLVRGFSLFLLFE